MAVPWAQIIRWAPELITISRELLHRTRKPSSSSDLVPVDEPVDLSPRVALLEENERRQAELVERMAEQQAELARALFALHGRVRWMMGAIALLAAVVVTLAAYVALR